MQSPDRYHFRLSKYHKLNLIVITIILVILLAVFFWYERSLDKIDAEMTKEMIGKRISKNETIDSHKGTREEY